MIRDIITLLPNVKAECEILQIAKGKYKLAETLKEGLQQIKNEIQWQKR